jgi:hypothetical protein
MEEAMSLMTSAEAVIARRGLSPEVAAAVRAEVREETQRRSHSRAVLAEAGIDPSAMLAAVREGAPPDEPYWRREFRGLGLDPAEMLGAGR